MPELAEVDYFRKRWNPGLKQRIKKILLHEKKRLFRGVDTAEMAKALKGATLEHSESRGKQMIFVARQGKSKASAWIGIHLGMTGALRLEKPDYTPAKHDHLVLLQAKHALIFQDARMFGRVQFTTGADAPNWWAKLPPDLLSSKFTFGEMDKFLKRRARAPLKAVLLMQERFPGIGNWMADEILWRAAIHPRRLAGTLTPVQTKALYREIRWVCREALRIIGTKWDDPPDSWLFNHRWKKAAPVPAPAQSSSTPPSADAPPAGRPRGRG